MMISRYQVICSCLCVLALSASASPFEDPQPFLERHQRSIEGQVCNVENEFKCNLAYTTCNKNTGICECDSRVAVSMLMPLFPEVTQCIPLEYVNVTGLCLPTSPDICSLLVPGSFCDTTKRDGSAGKMKCACKIGGTYPNCVVRVGSLCRSNETCSRDIPDSFCGNMTNGYGKCTCGAVDNKGFISNRAGTACKPTNCAARPCRGDLTASTCRDTPSGYECSCNNNTKGRSHDFSTDGICCNDHMVTCHDFSKCIKVTDLCNGISDCDDCSDEMQLYCTGPLPKKNPRCFRSFSPAGTVSANSGSTKETPAVTEIGVITPQVQPQRPVAVQQLVPINQVRANPQVAVQLAQAAGASSMNAAITNQQRGASGVNGLYNPYSGAANVLRTNVPTVGIPAIEVVPGLG